jgi:phosphoribosylformylglycinamidine cyclo-ligase
MSSQAHCGNTIVTFKPRAQGEKILRTHRNYQTLLIKVSGAKLKGLANITGGGLIDNLPCILPDDCDAVIETTSWKVQPIFQIRQEREGVDRHEMYQVFNMDIGMVAIVAPNDAAAIGKQLRVRVIGRIAQGRGVVQLAGL